jgi:hypothetical protein
MNIGTFEQTITIPADRHVGIDIQLPETVSSGIGKVIIIYTEQPSQKSSVTADKSSVEAVPGPDYSSFSPEAQAELKRMDEIAARFPCRSYKTLEEAVKAAEVQKTPAGKEEFHLACKKAYGALEHSKVWGKDVDVVAEIRKMRDTEWPNLWEETNKEASLA